MDFKASLITQLIGINCNSVNRYLRATRERISEFCETQSPFLGEVEVMKAVSKPGRLKDKEARDG